jgi:hypothetical protein
MGYATQKTFSVLSSWVPVFAGFSADPTVTARYLLIGKMCFYWVTATAHGTSNSTTASGKTMTLPFTSYNGTTQNTVAGRITNNGANQSAPGLGLIASNSNVMTVYRDSTLVTTWTASGNCSWSISGVYEIA